MIPVSQNFFVKRITEYVSPIHISSKETYISYFIKVKYIPTDDIPHAEDIHIEYMKKDMKENVMVFNRRILSMNDKDFHKRLQITKNSAKNFKLL